MKSHLAGTVLVLLTVMLLLAAATSATAQAYTDLYDFDDTHGLFPFGALVQGRDGNLYGTTLGGGTKKGGVAFRITPSGAFTVLSNFDEIDGGSPTGLALGPKGNFYGATEGRNNTGYAGTIFRMTGAKVVNLYNFGAEGNPFSPPIQGDDGNFYGTATSGPTAHVYRFTPSGVFTWLVSVPGGNPAGLAKGTDGNFYTTAPAFSAYNNGAVFKITPAGIVTTLYVFDYTHGQDPHGVIQVNDGDLYGTTETGGSVGGGVVFQLTPRGDISVLHNFPDPHYPNDGEYPMSPLLQASDGNFYGATSSGGKNNCGVIFSITPEGVYSILHNFDAFNGWPRYRSSAPTQHTNGKIFGLEIFGGAYGQGVAYGIDLGLPPFVSLVSTSGKVGTSITILGQGFTGTTDVSFNGTPATFKVWSDTFLKATVPSGATTGPVTVTAPTGILTSNHPFRVHPVILSVTPGTGAAGNPVIINGTSFTQTTKVIFGGGKAAATFTVDSDSQVTATVPAGAPSGYILLTTPSGRSRSPDAFTVTP